MSVSAPCASDPPSDLYNADYNWATFMSAYASGQWNPHRSPKPPRSVLQLSLRTIKIISPESPDLPSLASQPVDPPHTASDSLMGRRFRKSLNDLRLPNAGHTMHLSLDGTQGMNLSPDATTAAATMRVAAVRVNISPLALPSPEHELTDPMRGVHAAIPGSHPPNGSPPIHQGTPSNVRKTRLGSFWEGTQDVDEDVGTLSTISASSPDSPFKSEADGVASVVSSADHTPLCFLPSSATAPISRSLDAHTEEDYFSVYSTRANSLETPPRGLISDITSHSQPYGNLHRDIEPTTDPNISTAPALPRRICLTRQTSSPLPNASFRDRILPGCRSVSDTISNYHIARAAKEEQMFLELGYLAPPNPPDELERRRALHKYVDRIIARTCISYRSPLGSTYGTLPPTLISIG